ncbi:MAG: L-threonylcarbamoyladenylate synthase [Nitrospira sp.]|jgi:L-threonylcarbamoyladenylate synthase|nr:L-threonylcarbamoyladenylate synthase [Nitrospira sp.]
MAIITPYRATEVDSLSASLSGVLRAGGVVALPTETYYGLGANPFDAAAIDRLLAVKGRPDGKPILVLIGDRAQLDGLVGHVPPAAKALMEAYWPGPLTIVFPANNRLPANLTAGTGTVGIRLTSCGPLADLLRRIGPLTGTSANRSGAPPVQTAQDVNLSLGNEVALIVDAGMTPGGLPSTVVSICDGVTILREGAIAPLDIEKTLTAQGLHLQ